MPEPEILVIETPVPVETPTPVAGDHTGYDQMRTDFSDKYDHNDLVGANQAIQDWYNVKVQPLLADHQNFVYRYYLGVNEANKDALLDTCKMGTKCRFDNEEKMKSDIAEEWKKVMKSFKDDVELTLVKTETIVSDGWDAAVQCQIDHPCCEFNEVAWDNIQKQIETKVNTIIDKQKQAKEISKRISDMKEKCEAYNIDWAAFDAAATQLDNEAAAQ